MGFSVKTIIEKIVDFTHEEVLELEAHLGIHPNRKPADPVEPGPAATEKTEVADPAIQSVVNGLENKLNTAETTVDELTGQLKAATDRVGELETELASGAATVTDLQQQVADLKAAVEAANTPAQALPQTGAEPKADLGPAATVGQQGTSTDGQETAQG